MVIQNCCCRINSTRHEEQSKWNGNKTKFELAKSKLYELIPQKRTRRARIRIVAAINMRFRISREFLHASEKGIEINVSARSPRPVLVRLGSNLSSPPILLRLLLSSRTLLASLRSLTTRSMYARGVTVNQGWREADDYPTEARVSTDVSEGGSQAVMNLRENKFWRTGPLARLNRNGEQAGKP